MTTSGGTLAAGEADPSAKSMLAELNVVVCDPCSQAVGRIWEGFLRPMGMLDVIWAHEALFCLVNQQRKCRASVL